MTAEDTSYAGIGWYITNARTCTCAAKRHIMRTANFIWSERTSAAARPKSRTVIRHRTANVGEGIGSVQHGGSVCNTGTIYAPNDTVDRGWAGIGNIGLSQGSIIPAKGQVLPIARAVQCAFAGGGATQG